MSYIWTNGELITDQKLNSMSNVLIIDLSGETVSNQDYELLINAYSNIDTNSVVILGNFGKGSTGFNRYGILTNASVGMAGLSFTFKYIDIGDTTLFWERKSFSGNRNIQTATQNYALTKTN